MYAYVDETGNTGNRIFDLDQPLFITAAMMTRANFDAIQTAAVAAIAKKAGVHELHANEMGVAKVEEIANDILKVVKVAQARFFLSRLEKRYLGATKVIDTDFDPQNRGAQSILRPMKKPLTLDPSSPDAVRLE